MKTKEIRIEGGGQHCEVIIRQRENGTCFAMFTSQRGFGHPTFETAELEVLALEMRRNTEPAPEVKDEKLAWEACEECCSYSHKGGCACDCHQATKSEQREGKGN